MTDHRYGENSKNAHEITASRSPQFYSQNPHMWLSALLFTVGMLFLSSQVPTISGALFGAGASLLGAWITELNNRRANVEDKARREVDARKYLAPELNRTIERALYIHQRAIPNFSSASLGQKIQTGDTVRPTYENVYIGTFIFSLGYMFGSEKKGYRTSVAIELYQQTRKGESLVGDLLTSVGGKCIILEFKRDHSEIGEELKKESKAQLRRKLQSDGDARFLEISRRCHHIAIAAAYSDSNQQCLAFLPYIDLVTKDHKTHQWVGDPAFCQRYISPDSFECGVSPEDFRYYIGKLVEVTGGTCGGLAVSVDKDGLKSAVVFEDVRELSMSLVQAEQEAEREIQRLEPSRSGPSHGR